MITSILVINWFPTCLQTVIFIQVKQNYVTDLISDNNLIYHKYTHVVTTLFWSKNINLLAQRQTTHNMHPICPYNLEWIAMETEFYA
jgi:hypothetical protein